MVTNAFDIKFESKPENITLVEQFIENVCKEHNITDEAFGNIFIGLTEAANNAIYHGNDEDPTKSVVMRLEEKNDTSITFFVSDEGPGFDPDELPDPTAPENIENPTGRGVFLMQQLSEDLSYNEKGNEATIKFSIQ